MLVWWSTWRRLVTKGWRVRMVEASSSTGIRVSQEDREGEMGVDLTSRSISTSCSDASKFVATQGDMGEGACGV